MRFDQFNGRAAIRLGFATPSSYFSDVNGLIFICASIVLIPANICVNDMLL